MSILSGVGVKEDGSTSPAVDGTETTAGLSTALAYGGFNVSNPLFEILDLAGDAFVVMDDASVSSCSIVPLNGSSSTKRPT